MNAISMPFQWHSNQTLAVERTDGTRFVSSTDRDGLRYVEHGPGAAPPPRCGACDLFAASGGDLCAFHEMLGDTNPATGLPSRGGRWDGFHVTAPPETARRVDVVAQLRKSPAWRDARRDEKTARTRDAYHRSRDRSRLAAQFMREGIPPMEALMRAREICK